MFFLLGRESLKRPLQSKHSSKTPVVRPNEEEEEKGEEENDAGATAQKPQLLSLTLHKADTLRKTNKLAVECVVRCSNTLKGTCTATHSLDIVMQIVMQMYCNMLVTRKTLMAVIWEYKHINMGRDAKCQHLFFFAFTNT